MKDSPINFNYGKKYKCPICGLKFRLKATMLFHKCSQEGINKLENQKI